MKTPLTRRPLTVRHQKYIDGVLAGKSGRQAAIDAGFSAGSASSRALELNQHPEVMAAVAAGRAQLRKATQYDVEAAFRELDDAIDFATKTNNASARIKGVEAKARMVGILDKPNHSIGLDISALLAQAHGRLNTYRANQLAEVQDAKVIDVTAARAGVNIDIFG